MIDLDEIRIPETMSNKIDMDQIKREYENSFTCKKGHRDVLSSCDFCKSDQLHLEIMFVGSDYIEENDITSMGFLFQCTNCKMLSIHYREVNGKLKPEE